MMRKKQIRRKVINTDHHNVRENGLRKLLDGIKINPQ